MNIEGGIDEYSVNEMKSSVMILSGRKNDSCIGVPVFSETQISCEEEFKYPAFNESIFLEHFLLENHNTTRHVFYDIPMVNFRLQRHSYLLQYCRELVYIPKFQLVNQYVVVDIVLDFQRMH